MANSEFDPMCGAILLGENLTAVDIWIGLHGNARELSTESYIGDQQDRMMIDGTDLGVLKSLTDFPEEQWKQLCSGVGWTAYGAVGLSWCKDATIQDVCAAWEYSGVELNTSEQATRPARLINAALLPQTTSLRALAETVNNNPYSISILIAAKDVPLVFDLPENMLHSAPEPLASFLKLNLAMKSSRNSGEDKLLMALGGNAR